jgi:hypothetical protein
VKTIDFFGDEIRLDENGTWDLYKSYNNDWCQCDNCTNARMTRRIATPPKQSEILAQMSLSPLIPYESSTAEKEGNEPEGWVRRVSIWFLYGELPGADVTTPIEVSPNNRMWIETRRDRVDLQLQNLTKDALDDPGLIYVAASNCVPWLYTEVEGDFTAENSPCPECHLRYRMSAELKQDSRLPLWMGVALPFEIASEEGQNVCVLICEQCGHLEYDLAPKESG